MASETVHHYKDNHPSGNFTELWCYGHLVNGMGFVVPLTTPRNINITSCEIFISNEWKSLTYSTIYRTLLQDYAAFTGASAQGAEFGNSYLVRITGTVS